MSADKRRPNSAKPGAEPTEEGGFLDRWSRRKAAARRGELEPEPQQALVEPEAEPVEEAPAADEATLDDAALAERYGLPDPATLNDESDFKPFMREGVPSRLRNSALRKLWLSSPDLACVDGLLEYGEDYTGLGYVGKLQTAYEVGSGFAKRIAAWEEEEAKKAAEKELAEKAGVETLKSEAAALPEAPEEAGAEASAGQADPAATAVANGPADAGGAAPASAPKEPARVGSGTRARMRFRFEQG